MSATRPKCPVDACPHRVMGRLSERLDAKGGGRWAGGYEVPGVGQLYHCPTHGLYAVASTGEVLEPAWRVVA